MMTKMEFKFEVLRVRIRMLRLEIALFFIRHVRDPLKRLPGKISCWRSCYSGEPAYGLLAVAGSYQRTPATGRTEAQGERLTPGDGGESEKP